MSVDSDMLWHTLPSVLWESNMASKTCRRCCKDWNALVRWRHHCRFCGQLVCDNCSVPRESYAHIQKPSRTCWPCSALIRALLMEEVEHWEFYEQLAEQTESRGDSPSTIADEVVDRQLARMPTCCDILTADLGDLDAAGDSTDNSFALETPTKQHSIMLQEMGFPEHTSGFAEGKANDRAAVVPITPPPQDITKPVSFYRSPMVESPNEAVTAASAVTAEQAEMVEAETEVTTPWSEVVGEGATPSTQETAEASAVDGEAAAESKAGSEVNSPWSVVAAEEATLSTLEVPNTAGASLVEPEAARVAAPAADDTRAMEPATEAVPTTAVTETAHMEPTAKEEGVDEAPEAAEGSQEGTQEGVVPEEATSAAPAGKDETVVSSREPPAQKKNKKKNKGK